MAQSILDVPIDSLRRQVASISGPNLRNLIRGIYELKYTIRDGFSDTQVLDLERKESIIQAEMQRRGYLGKKDAADYMTWRNGLFRKKNY